MKIICDVGNTNSKILIVGDKIKFIKIKTSEVIQFVKSYSDYPFFVSCVVKEVQSKLKEYCKLLKIVSYKDLKYSMVIKYDTTNLGSDRVLSAFAAKRIFGGDSLVASFGTTIVLDYINSKGEYVGGEIFPGLKLLSESLFHATSRLPLVSQKKILKSKQLLIGSNTEECIVYGILNFCISGINNFMQKLKPKNVIFTGGDAKVFKKYIHISKVYFIDNLVLLGMLFLLYDWKEVGTPELRRILQKQEFSEVLDIRKII